MVLKFADGSQATGDALIGADGIKSVIRTQIVGERQPEYTGDVAWRLMVPTERVRPNIMDGKSAIWVGPKAHAVSYFLRGGELLNFVAVVECDEWTEESWTQKYPWELLKADLKGWHEDIQEAVDNVDKDECYRWSLNIHEPVDNWSTERTTLLGDAAHPTLPYLAQGAVMAVEDGAVLTRALDMAGSVPEALQIYQHNRLERTAKIVRESSRNRGIFHRETAEELRAAFANRNMDRERAQWLYSYNPLTVALEEPTGPVTATAG